MLSEPISGAEADDQRTADARPVADAKRRFIAAASVGQEVKQLCIGAALLAGELQLLQLQIDFVAPRQRAPYARSPRLASIGRERRLACAHGTAAAVRYRSASAEQWQVSQSDHAACASARCRRTASSLRSRACSTSASFAASVAVLPVLLEQGQIDRHLHRDHVGERGSALFIGELQAPVRLACRSRDTGFRLRHVHLSIERLHMRMMRDVFAESALLCRQSAGA